MKGEGIHRVFGQRSREVWGHAPQENFRPYEIATEAVGDHHNHTKFMATGL